MSITPGTSGERDAAPARPTPTPSSVSGATNDDTLRGLGGNLVGSDLDEAHGVEPGDGSLLEHRVPLGSALADVHGRHPVVQGEDLPGGADMGLDAGRDVPGGSGGERADAGGSTTRTSRTDAARPPRRDGFE